MRGPRGGVAAAAPNLQGTLFMTTTVMFPISKQYGEESDINMKSTEGQESDYCVRLGFSISEDETGYAARLIWRHFCSDRRCIPGVGGIDRELQEESRLNGDEVEAVYDYFEEVVRSGVFAPVNIGVMSAHRSQLDAFRRRFCKHSSDMVTSVDEFQGQETPCIFDSCVRSNASGVGRFHMERRHQGVVMMRASKQLAIFNNALCLMEGNHDGSW